MNQHLSDEQIAACLAGEGEREAATHLSSCAQCQGETSVLSGAIAGFRATVDAAAPRNVAWENVSLGHAKTAGTRFQAAPWGIPALAALALVAFVMLLRAPDQAAVNAREAAREASDEALLLQVQSAIRSPAPRALAPAQTIADERTTILVANSTTSSQNSNRRINK